MPLQQMIGGGRANPTGMGAVSPYPGGDEIMAGREQAQADMGEQNPVVDALKVLQMYVVAQREKGNEAPLAAYMQFLNSLQGAPQQQQMPAQAPVPQQAPAPAQGPAQPMRENQNAGTVLSQ